MQPESITAFTGIKSWSLISELKDWMLTCFLFFFASFFAALSPMPPTKSHSFWFLINPGILVNYHVPMQWFKHHILYKSWLLESWLPVQFSLIIKTSSVWFEELLLTLACLGINHLYFYMHVERSQSVLELLRMENVTQLATALHHMHKCFPVGSFIVSNLARHKLQAAGHTAAKSACTWRELLSGIWHNFLMKQILLHPPK